MLEAPEVDVAEILGYTAPDDILTDNAQCGLQNLGNTCYLNALLHALARIPSIRTWCHLHQRKFVSDAAHASQCILCHLALDVACITVDITPEKMAPETVKRRGVWSKGRFANILQHDVHDAFCTLLDECEGVDYLVAKSFDLVQFARNREVNSVRYTTPFWKAFGGVQRSGTSCRACGHGESRYEMWHNLELALPSQRSTLEHVLANHWGREPLDSENDRCGECHVSRQRDKVVELVRWPQVLVLLLKRWKVVSLTPFQLENVPTEIDFETLLLVATDQAPYHLRAVIIHCGDAGAGHYTSYVRATDHRWYFCDDWSPPREVGVAEVLSERLLSQAYMLFYES